MYTKQPQGEIVTILLDTSLATFQAGELSLDTISALRKLCRKYRLGLLPEGADLRDRLKQEEFAVDLVGEGSPAPRFAVSDDPDFLAHHSGGATFPLLILGEGKMRDLDRLDPATLTFHTLKTATDWILEHPDPDAYLEEALAAGAAAILRGELTVFPTETVYGLGADATNEEAVRRIFLAKERPEYDPLIVHIGDLDQLMPLVRELPEQAKLLAERFWPGPLTLVLPKSSAIPDLVSSSHPTLAVRMPSNPYALELIRRAAVPVAAPSANLFGRTSPTTATHVIDQLDGRFQALIDAGACRVGVESTVLSLADGDPVLLRNGGISREEIEALIGPVRMPVEAPPEENPSPGMLPSHYAPLTPLQMVESVYRFRDNPEIGAILYAPSGATFAGPTVCVSSDRNPKEIAINIYAALRELDRLGLKTIVAEWCSPEGVGAAVNERLKKASAPK